MHNSMTALGNASSETRQDISIIISSCFTLHCRDTGQQPELTRAPRSDEWIYTQYMVHFDFVADDEMLNEKTSIHCAHGDPRS